MAASFPSELKAADHWAPKFLVALLSLYVGEYEQALEYVDSVLALHQCQEALYVNFLRSLRTQLSNRFLRKI